MTEAQVLAAFHDSWLGVEMRAIPWLFSICETLHFIGLSTLFGALLVVDLRLLGFFKRLPIGTALTLIPVGLVGFAINAITGLCFFTFDPPNYWHNPDFRLKMAAIALAGLNALWFTFGETPRLLRMPEHEDTGASTKICAGLSILIWISVIVFGRLLEVFAP